MTCINGMNNGVLLINHAMTKKNAHLLKQQQHQIKIVHTRKPHFPLKTRNIHCLRLTFFELLQKNENS
ncbi:hypothetical protein [Escherichia coli ISC7]|uniref:Uncharacterized protein n=1 Tax=Escherichia coli ISC7 TaxID=1432555 RepID=W1F4X6_ECOLX|nr:hypothetical protein [Escherichia coli ISC7]